MGDNIEVAKTTIVHIFYYSIQNLKHLLIFRKYAEMSDKLDIQAK